MKISLNWIRDFIDLKIIDKKSLEHVVVGHVDDLWKHPNADTLNVAKVNVGEDLVQIVCGGINLKKNAYVPVALPGAVLPGNFEIRESKIRGEESKGMICAMEELGLGENKPREIWLLDGGKQWTPGEPLLKALKIDGHSPQEIGIAFTHHTAEVEGVEPEGPYLNHVVTGKLLEYSKIEGSDKLHKGLFDIGWKKITVIFGSVYKIQEDEILPIALPGAKLPGGDIKVTEMLGVKSEGMVCGDSEMGIQNSLEGITRFPKDTPLGKPVAEVLCMNGNIMEVDNKSLTHRPDLWGHYGIARELAAIYGKKLAPLDSFIKIPAPKGKSTVHIDIQDDTLCPRFSAALMSGIKIEESPAWMKARLQAAGMNPHNNIVDITNYVMLELGQPMHAYDRSVLGSDILRARFAKKGEKLLTLEGTEHPLTPEDPVITDGKDQPVGIAGIKGGMKSGISNSTTEIVLECATFDPIVIRKASVRHALRTDASQRFEKSLDPTLTELALKRAIHLILELCPGAKLEGPVETVGTWKPKKVVIKISPESICSKIGVPIPTPKIISLLKSLEFGVEKTGKLLTVTVPSHRASRDVLIPEDLVEEVARLYGYNNLPALFPEKPLELPRENVERSLKHAARSILSRGLGFTEVVNYSFYGKDRLEKCGLDEKDHLKVLNYLSLDQTHMRTTLAPNLLANVASNARERASIKIFELGHTYKEVGDYMPLEEKRLTAVVAHDGEAFYSAKGALEAFLKAFQVTQYELKPSSTVLPYAHPKKSLDLVVKGKTVGVVFTVHPAVRSAFDIAQDVAMFSVQFSHLIEQGRELNRFSPLPKFPAVPFDISVLVDRKKTVAEVETAIRSVDSNGWIEAVELFDIYEGKNIPEGQKSLSFNVTLRHPEHTLSDAEFKTLYSSVCNALSAAGGTIRGL